MALPDTIKLSGATQRTSGIASAALSAGGNVVGSAIDNASNLDALCDIEIVFTCASAPTAGQVIEAYLLYAPDGTNFEDGSDTVDPQSGLVGVAVARAVTTAQRVLIRNVALLPYAFKVLLKSELGQAATVTANVYTRNDAVVE